MSRCRPHRGSSRAPYSKNQQGRTGRPAPRRRGGRHSYHAQRIGRPQRAQSKCRGQWRRGRAAAFAPGRCPPARPLLAQVIRLNATATRDGNGSVGRPCVPSGSSANPRQSTGWPHSTPPQRQVHLSASRHQAGVAQGSRVGENRALSLLRAAASSAARRARAGSEQRKNAGHRAECAAATQLVQRGRRGLCGKPGEKRQAGPFSRHAVDVNRPINSQRQLPF